MNRPFISTRQSTTILRKLGYCRFPSNETCSSPIRMRQILVKDPTAMIEFIGRPNSTIVHNVFIDGALLARSHTGMARLRA